MGYDELNVKRFEIIERIAVHPLARTFLARQVNLGRYVSIRHIATQSAQASPRFRNELEALAMLRHPHNGRLLDVGAAQIEGEDGPYAVFQYLPGEPLGAALTRCGSLSTAQVLWIARQLLGALSEAHRGGLLHRQLTPWSLWISQHTATRDHLTVFDYGVEHALDPHRWWTQIRQSGQVVGDYAAPEVLRGEAASEASDVYSAAAVLYHAACGELFTSVADTRVDLQPVKASAVDALRDELLDVLDRALEREPEGRFASASTFLDALEPVFERAQRLSAIPYPLIPWSGEAIGSADKEKLEPTKGQPTEHPSIWIIHDDPVFEPAFVARLKQVAAHYRVLVLSRDQAREFADALKKGEIRQPWLVIFGDLHVILEIRLLRAVRDLSGVQRILVSAQLNAQMLEKTVNFCGVDKHLVLPASDGTLSEAIEARMAVCRRAQDRRRTYDTLPPGHSELTERPSITGRFAAQTS